MATNKTDKIAEVETKATEKKTNATKKDETVTIMVPIIPGEDKEITVGINGRYTKIRRGETVEVSKDVAEVIANANMQMLNAKETQEKFKDQEFDWQ